MIQFYNYTMKYAEFHIVNLNLLHHGREHYFKKDLQFCIAYY